MISAELLKNQFELAKQFKEQKQKIKLEKNRNEKQRVKDKLIRLHSLTK
jgi:hypothetical protein